MIGTKLEEPFQETVRRNVYRWQADLALQFLLQFRAFFASHAFGGVIGRRFKLGRNEALCPGGIRGEGKTLGW